MDLGRVLTQSHLKRARNLANPWGALTSSGHCPIQASRSLFLHHTIFILHSFALGPPCSLCFSLIAWEKGSTTQVGGSRCRKGYKLYIPNYGYRRHSLLAASFLSLRDSSVFCAGLALLSHSLCCSQSLTLP